MSNDSVPRNSRQQAAELDGLFRPRDAEPGPSAYRSESGEALPPRGDDQAPWLKVPPFATPPQLWVRDFAVPQLEVEADYAPVTVEPIDCLQQRILQLYFELNIAADGEDEVISQLSFIPEGFAAGNPYVVGVVDLTVTPTVLVSARFGAGEVGSRTFYQAELRSPQYSFTGGGRVRFILAFDVSPFESFRLNVLDLVGENPGTALTLHYAFCQ